MFKLSLKVKIIILVILSALIVDAGCLFVVLKQFNSSVKNEILKQSDQTVDQIYELNQLYFSRIITNLQPLAEDHVIKSFLNKPSDQAAFNQIVAKLTQVKNQNPFYINIGLHDADCFNLAADDHGLAIKGKSFSDRDYCLGVKSSKNVYISSSFKSAITNGLIVAVSVPVFNEQNKFIGFLVGAVNLDDLKTHLDDLTNNNRYLMVDGKKQIFLDTNEKGNEVGLIKDEVFNNLLNQNLNEHPDGGNFEYIAENNESYFVFYKRFISAVGEITVVFQQSFTGAFFLKDENLISLAAVAGLGTLVYVFIIWFLLGILLKKLSNLDGVLNNLPESSWNKALMGLEGKNNDEFDVLVKTIGGLLKELEKDQNLVEKKVAERTKDLEKTNQLMIGRELKMLELKKEITELKNKLNSKK